MSDHFFYDSSILEPTHLRVATFIFTSRNNLRMIQMKNNESEKMIKIKLYHYSDVPPEIILKEGLRRSDDGYIYAIPAQNDLFTEGFGQYCYTFSLYPHEFVDNMEEAGECVIDFDIPAHLITLEVEKQ